VKILKRDYRISTVAAAATFRLRSGWRTRVNARAPVGGSLTVARDNTVAIAT
jgi:hypothetical protein